MLLALTRTHVHAQLSAEAIMSLAQGSTSGCTGACFVLGGALSTTARCDADARCIRRAFFAMFVASRAHALVRSHHLRCRRPAHAAAAAVLPTPFALDAWSRAEAGHIYNATIEDAFFCACVAAPAAV